MYPRDIALVERAIGAFLSRERRGDQLVNPGAKSKRNATEAPDDAVSERGVITLAILHLANGVGKFGDAEEGIGKAASKFPCEPLIVHRGVLDISEKVGGGGEKEEGAEEAFHRTTGI